MAQIDWLTDATIEAQRDKGTIRGAHYSWFITEQEATELASKAIADNNPWWHYSGPYCDRHHLYGVARAEVNSKVSAIHNMLRKLTDSTDYGKGPA